VRNRKAKLALVTGGAGFIGSHLIDALLAQGAAVVCLDSYLTGRPQNLRHLEHESRFDMVEADVIDTLPARIRRTPFTHIYNLACARVAQGRPDEALELLAEAFSMRDVLRSDAAADPRALFGALVRRHPAPHAALLRFGEVAVVSASPERFLRRRDDAVETRPIKGTAGRRVDLVHSGKDRAENVMITDLARNDFGRVCLPGSVAVPALCAPEAHPGLWHLVSTVTGRLRPGVGTGQLVRATFPPASVTGRA